jgi:hypothetical protein
MEIQALERMVLYSKCQCATNIILQVQLNPEPSSGQKEMKNIAEAQVDCAVIASQAAGSYPKILKMIPETFFCPKSPLFCHTLKSKFSILGPQGLPLDIEKSYADCFNSKREFWETRN